MALRAGNSGSSTFSFPVWVGEEVLSVLAGKNVRPSPWRKRGSLALLVSAFGSAAWMTRDSCTAYGVWLLGGPFALIKPWHVGDRHELELIKATIEAFQARAAEGFSGASPPNP